MSGNNIKSLQQQQGKKIAAQTSDSSGEGKKKRSIFFSHNPFKKHFFFLNIPLH